MQMSELNVTPATKHSFHLPHCSRARSRFAAIVPGLLRDWNRLSNFTTEDTTLKDPPENIYTESEELKMERGQRDVNQLVNNASGSNRDLIAMLETMSQFQATNLEVLNQRHEDEICIIFQVWKESLEIRQHLELHWVLSPDVQLVPKEL